MANWTGVITMGPLELKNNMRLACEGKGVVVDDNVNILGLYLVTAQCM